MTTNSVEDRLNALEKANKDLQEKLEYTMREAERAKAATDCLKLVNSYCYYHAQGRNRDGTC